VASSQFASIPPEVRRELKVQREITRLLSPIALTAVALALRFGFGYRIEGLAQLRSDYRRVCLENDTPTLICANHLTLIDSFIIAWALGSPGWYLRNFRTLPWNVPEQSIFAATPLLRSVIYIMKCLPIQRGGDRRGVTVVLSKLAHLVSKGETALIFPEAGRSRSGRIQLESAATGVGRIFKSVPNCRVICVYLRGEKQESYSNVPSRGDRFRGALEVIEPKTDHLGVRGSRDISHQVLARLADMERSYFDARK
jgi:1-acyl-sn-glycerol-3-phosphate acyltransferase